MFISACLASVICLTVSCFLASSVMTLCFTNVRVKYGSVIYFIKASRQRCLRRDRCILMAVQHNSYLCGDQSRGVAKGGGDCSGKD